MSDPTRDLLGCAAAFLEQGAIVDRLSRPLTGAALIGILIAPALANRPPWTLIGFASLVAAAGLAEVYLAIRVGFDAALFRRLAQADEASDFQGTDAALTRLGLMPVTKVGRAAEVRIAGARHLLRLQILSLAAQVLFVVAGAVIVLMWR